MAAILAAILKIAAYLITKQDLFWSNWIPWPPKYGCRHQTYNSEANNNGIMTILSNLIAILVGILDTILDLQLTWLLIRFKLVNLDFLTHKTWF